MREISLKNFLAPGSRRSNAVCGAARGRVEYRGEGILFLLQPYAYRGSKGRSEKKMAPRRKRTLSASENKSRGTAIYSGEKTDGRAQAVVGGAEIERRKVKGRSQEHQSTVLKK